MNTEPVSLDDAAATRTLLLKLLGIILLAAVIVMFGFSWLDARKTPSITFMSSPDSQIAIDVRGAIATPGVVFLDSGDRIVDVVDVSGGFSPSADVSLINLSTRVYDGQMLVFPTQAPTEGSSSGVNPGLININSASVEELKQLPGIGDVLAQRIVLHREFNGPYLSPNDLTDVEGISPSLVESISPYITVTNND